MADAKEEIRGKYERIAGVYDLSEGLLEAFGLRKLRRRLLASAGGRILDVAAGTGRNLRYYRGDARVTAADLSAAMLRVAGRRAARLGLAIDRVVVDAEALAFPEAAFDTVISSLGLCTYPDPVAALREMRRVCCPDGRILLLEHGRSDRENIARWQDRHSGCHVRAACCHWNREPLDLVREAGLRLLASHRHFFGVFHTIEAGP